MILFKLIGLPFAVLGSLLGLVGISTSILLLPLKFVVRNPILTLILVFILFAYITSGGGKGAGGLSQLQPAPQDRQAPNLPKGKIPVVEKVTKYEDGNSAFAVDVYNTMTDDERLQYSRVFYAVMSRVADGKSFSWKYYNINGELTPTSTFKNNSGASCRTFKEVLKVHKVQQTIDGTACDNGGGEWCKLKVNATPACGLGGDGPGLFDGVQMPSWGRSLKNLF